VGKKSSSDVPLRVVKKKKDWCGETISEIKKKKPKWNPPNSKMGETWGRRSLGKGGRKRRGVDNPLVKESKAKELLGEGRKVSTYWGETKRKSQKKKQPSRHPGYNTRMK